MLQKTLDNIHAKICPKCKKGLKVDVITESFVIYWCPDCMKEYKFSICQNCFDLFEFNEFKLCEKCRIETAEFLVKKPLVL